MNHFRPAFALIVFFTLLTGLAFPLLFVAGAGAIAPTLAGGSLIKRGDVVVGSALLGQNFVADKYLHGRPSATQNTDPADATKTISVPYDASSSGASNLAPTDKALIDRVTADVKTAGGGPVPADMVTTSASGLDPNVSPANAARQVARIAAARKLTPAQVQGAIDANTHGRLLGLVGEPRVDVLAANMAMDALTP